MQNRPWRESLDIPGLAHGNNPIPMGARVGNMVFSSGLHGGDPATGKIPQDAAQQVVNVFRNLETLLARAGATLGDVGHVSVSAADASVREHVNREWLQRFPDPASRPARHTTVKPLPGGMLVQLEIIAVVKND